MFGLDAFESVYAVGLLVAFAMRLRERFRYRNAPVTDDRRDAMELLVILLAFCGMLAIPVIHLSTDAFAFADYRQPRAVGLFGTVMFRVGADPPLAHPCRPRVQLVGVSGTARFTSADHNGCLQLRSSSDVCVYLVMGTGAGIVAPQFHRRLRAVSSLRAVVFHPSSSRRADDARSLWRIVCFLHEAHRTNTAAPSQPGLIVSHVVSEPDRFRSAGRSSRHWPRRRMSLRPSTP